MLTAARTRPFGKRGSTDLLPSWWHPQDRNPTQCRASLCEIRWKRWSLGLAARTRCTGSGGRSCREECSSSATLLLKGWSAPAACTSGPREAQGVSWTGGEGCTLPPRGGRRPAASAGTFRIPPGFRRVLLPLLGPGWIRLVRWPWLREAQPLQWCCIERALLLTICSMLLTQWILSFFSSFGVSCGEMTNNYFAVWASAYLAF